MPERERDANQREDHERGPPVGPVPDRGRQIRGARCGRQAGDAREHRRQLVEHPREKRAHVVGCHFGLAKANRPDEPSRVKSHGDQHDPGTPNRRGPASQQQGHGDACHESDAHGDRGERKRKRKASQDVAPQVFPADEQEGQEARCHREQVRELVAGYERIPPGAVEEDENRGKESDQRTHAPPGEYVQERRDQDVEQPGEKLIRQMGRDPKRPMHELQHQGREKYEVTVVRFQQRGRRPLATVQ